MRNLQTSSTESANPANKDSVKAILRRPAPHQLWRAWFIRGFGQGLFTYVGSLFESREAVYQCVLDVAGGGGGMVIAIGQRYPHLRSIRMDLPPVCEIAEEYIRAGGLADRAPRDMIVARKL